MELQIHCTIASHEIQWRIKINKNIQKLIVQKVITVRIVNAIVNRGIGEHLHPVVMVYFVLNPLFRHLFVNPLTCEPPRQCVRHLSGQKEGGVSVNASH